MNNTQTDHTIKLPDHIQGFERFLVEKINSILTKELNPENFDEYGDYIPYQWHDNPLRLELLNYATTATRLVCDFLGGKNIVINPGHFVQFSKFDFNVSFELDSKDISFRIVENVETIRTDFGSWPLKSKYENNLLSINGFHDNAYYLTHGELLSDVLFEPGLSDAEKVRLTKKFVSQIFRRVKTLLLRNYGVDLSNITFGDFWKKYGNILLENHRAYIDRLYVYAKKLGDLALYIPSRL